MSRNLAKEKRQDLLKKLKEIKDFLNNSSDVNAQKLIGFIGELENEVVSKKYGLVFEEHKEEIDEILEKNIPVFTEDKSLYIDNGGLENFLLEGDNLASLQLLEKTHKSKIDLIYIDPPYNRGKDDFIYDDDFIDSNDSFKHSKWASLINKRLTIAKRLLTDQGVIFISIDDNEQGALKLICDSIFGYENLISILPTIMNLKGNQDEFGFAGTHEYTLVYAKNKSKCSLNMFPVDEEELDDWEEDEIGYYKKGATLKRTGNDAPREKRPKCFYPILVKKIDKSVETITREEYQQIYNSQKKEFNDKYICELKEKYTKMGYDFILPIIEGENASWRWGFSKLQIDKKEVIVIGSSGSYSLYKKQRPELGDLPTKKPKTIFYKPEYSSGNGTAELKNIFKGDKVFNNPKPYELINDFVLLGSKKDSTILDFFAGSGTTGHSVLEMNKRDQGNRKFILCQGYEDGKNIALDVTYERLKTVITGKRKDGSEYSNGYKASLKYLKVNYIEITDKFYYEYADELLEHVKELVELENAINFDKDKTIAICLTEEEIDKFTESLDDKTELKKIYLGHDIQLTDKQDTLFENLGVEVIQIPEYYYDED